MKVEVSGITKQFGHSTALADVSLEFPSGELVALLGPSGSGKTTLLRILAGIETPDRGTVRFGSDDVTRRPIRERGIGFVFQNYALFEHMTVFDNIGFGLKVRGTPAAKIARRVKDLLQLVQLPGLGDRLPAQLSGGQRQRIALARALAPEPKVLLLDEPFGALDARVRRDLRTWLRKLHDEIHVTSVFVTHDQDEAFEVADRVVIMNDGQVEQIGDPQSLTSAPKTSFVREFLSAVARPAAAAFEACRISPVAVRSEAA